MQCSYIILKGHSIKMFELQFFFSSFEPPWAWALTNGLKYCRFWLSFHRVIQILESKKLTPHSTVWHCREIDSAQYDTARRMTQLILRRDFTTIFNDGLCAVYHIAGRLTPSSKILRGDWLSTASYCWETGPAQYDTARRFRKIQISQQKLN